MSIRNPSWTISKSNRSSTRLPSTSTPAGTRIDGLNSRPTATGAEPENKNPDGTTAAKHRTITSMTTRKRRLTTIPNHYTSAIINSLFPKPEDKRFPKNSKIRDYFEQGRLALYNKTAFIGRKRQCTNQERTTKTISFKHNRFV